MEHEPLTIIRWCSWLAGLEQERALLAAWPVAQPVGVAVAAGRQPGGFLEGAAERGGVGVADVTADPLDRITRGFEEAHGLLDACVPQVGLRPAAGGCRDPAREGTLAQPEPGREVADPERAAKKQVEVMLEQGHE